MVLSPVLQTARWSEVGFTSTILLSVTFALLAFRARGVDLGGAIAGAVLCFVFLAGGGYAPFAGLIAVFALAWISTKSGRSIKERLGTAEKAKGRNAYQILANLGVAAIAALLHGLAGKDFLLLAVAASLSEAAADTVSSEIGQLKGEGARLITTLERVPSGTDGGVTVLGTLAGLAAASLVSAVCAAGGMYPWRRIGIPIMAAFCGTVADSFLGAWLERRKVLNNDAVNFLGTLVAALIALGF